MTRFICPSDARSWVEVDPLSHFPIQNLPFGRAQVGDDVLTVSRIGDWIVDLSKFGISIDLERVTTQELSDARETLYRHLVRGSEACPDRLVAAAEIAMLVPIRPRAFVDFYSGIHHASNVGMMFRPDQPPLLPNYRHLPIGYNGRASTVFASGTEIIRPSGQTKAADAVAPTFGPTKELDFELEVGFYAAPRDESRISIASAEDNMLGLVIVNDWSARDVQRWEYQPLGPFLAKSFGTSVSSWIVTLDALEPFRVSSMEQDPAPLDYLRSSDSRAFDIQLEVSLWPAGASQSTVISRSNTRYLYWTFAQQLAHQASNGTRIEQGDLYASGTISGLEPDSFGSMLELSWRGTKPVLLADGSNRTFLLDGDELTMTAFAQGDGYRVGLGEVSGVVRPSTSL